jgi:hypothetical protein
VLCSFVIANKTSITPIVAPVIKASYRKRPRRCCFSALVRRLPREGAKSKGEEAKSYGSASLFGRSEKLEGRNKLRIAPATQTAGKLRYNKT